jgi:hypothetical protein
LVGEVPTEGAPMDASSSNFSDQFYVYPTVTGSVRVSAYTLRGLAPRALVRTSRLVPAPDDDLTLVRFDRWLSELRAAGVAAEVLPADDTTG